MHFTTTLNFKSIIHGKEFRLYIADESSYTVRMENADWNR